MRLASPATSRWASQGKNPDKTWFRCFKSIRWWWWWEIEAAVLSTTCIFLIFVTLLVMHGRPLDDWTLSISINATVSILATVAKSALMLLVAETISQLKWHHYDSTQSVEDMQTFDGASRGPWGATMFVLKARSRALLATIAAMVAVASIGFEPAAQQMLDFPLRSVSIETPGSAANVYQAVGFNTSDLLALRPSVISGMYPPNSLQVALINSFAGIVNDAAHNCPTARCVFGPIETFGVCERCRDATNEVQHIRNHTNEGGGSDGNGGSSYKTFHDYFIADDDFYPMATSNFTNHGAINGQTKFIVTTNFTSDFSDPSSRRAGFMAVNFTDMYKNVVESTTICDLSWCTRTLYGAEIVNGLFHIAREERSPLLITNITDDIIQSSFITFGSEQFRDRQYIAGQREEYVLWQYFADTLSGDSNSNSLVRMMSGRPLKRTAGFMSMAATNWLRTPANNGSEQLRGEAMASVTFVHVRWAWLAWPAVLTLTASAILFVCVLRDYRRDNLFKSSTLALLFHGLHGVDENDMKVHQHGRVEDSKGLEDAARQLRVKLMRDESGTLKLMKQ
jgi:hypothetical protein